MYDYIKGRLISKNAPKIVVENGGVGWGFLCNKRTASLLPDIGSDVKIYTKLIHKEDSMLLCGFALMEDRVIFDILTTVSGVGTKVAMVLLDEFSGSELIGAVISGDYKLISRAKGVGPKLAQKIILELKDKLTNSAATLDIISSKVKQEGLNVSCDTISEVQTILQSLGWGVSEYTCAVKDAVCKIEKDNSEELLKEALKILSMG